MQPKSHWNADKTYLLEEKLTMSSKDEKNNGKESKEPDYDEDKDQLEEKQEEEAEELSKQETINQVF